MKHDRAISKSIRTARSLESLERRLMLDAATELVADVNTTPIEDQEHAWLGDSVYFAADDGAGDVEL